jgi:aspartate racemase
MSRRPEAPRSRQVGRGTPVIGVLGGMGPAATVDFYGKLVALVPAEFDQSHPRVVIWADPTVPDRSTALSGGGEDPTPWLLNGADKLQRAGATVIAMPCNTAHAFLPRMSGTVRVPILNMIEEVAAYLRGRLPAVQTVGLLATTGTVRAGLYQRVLHHGRIKLLLPTPETQRTYVDGAIRALKAGRRGTQVEQCLRHATAELTSRGAELLIAGCTELPLGLSASEASCPVIDPAEVLARAVLGHVGFPSALDMAGQR